MRKPKIQTWILARHVHDVRYVCILDLALENDADSLSTSTVFSANVLPQNTRSTLNNEENMTAPYGVPYGTLL